MTGICVYYFTFRQSGFIYLFIFTFYFPFPSLIPINLFPDLIQSDLIPNLIPFHLIYLFLFIFYFLFLGFIRSFSGAGKLARGVLVLRRIPCYPILLLCFALCLTTHYVYIVPGITCFKVCVALYCIGALVSWWGKGQAVKVKGEKGI